MKSNFIKFSPFSQKECPFTIEEGDVVIAVGTYLVDEVNQYLVDGSGDKAIDKL